MLSQTIILRNPSIAQMDVWLMVSHVNRPFGGPVSSEHRPGLEHHYSPEFPGAGTARSVNFAGSNAGAKLNELPARDTRHR